jgi:hypothetical protein
VKLTILSCLLVACGGSSGTPDGATPIDSPAAGSDALPLDAPAPKAAMCTATFGSDLTPAFGRFDGTVLAIVNPGNEDCPMPNSTHLIVEATIDSVAYRLVVDVLSDQGDPDVYFHELDAPLVGSAWSEGWHTGAALDYVIDLQQTSTAFTSMPEAALVTTISDELDIGAHVSIYATSTAAEPNSAHLVHRNVTSQDGAIVIHPDGSGSAHYLLMRFDEQTF